MIDIVLVLMDRGEPGRFRGVSTKAADYPNALAEGAMLNEYRIVAVLGVGGFGITYLASDTHLEKDVAIK